MNTKTCKYCYDWYDVLYAPPGTKMRFLNRNGYNHEPEHARQIGLVENEWYTLEYINIYSSNSDISLKEFPGKVFNSVMFESAPYDEDYSYWMETFERYYGYGIDE